MPQLLEDLWHQLIEDMWHQLSDYIWVTLTKVGFFLVRTILKLRERVKNDLIPEQKSGIA